MKKKLIIGLLTTLLFAGGATAVLATDRPEIAELKDLYSQMANLQKQIVDTQAKAGNLTEDQVKAMKDAIDQKAEYQNQAIDNGQFVGPGIGGRMGQRGCGGFGGGPAGGFGGCGYNQAPNAASTNY